MDAAYPSVHGLGDESLRDRGQDVLKLRERPPSRIALEPPEREPIPERGLGQ